jgi:hypothetical protein
MMLHLRKHIDEAELVRFVTERFKVIIPKVEAEIGPREEERND